MSFVHLVRNTKQDQKKLLVTHRVGPKNSPLDRLPGALGPAACSPSPSAPEPTATSQHHSVYIRKGGFCGDDIR